MYHPYRLAAVALLLALSLPASAQGLLDELFVGSGLPDAVAFRAQMEWGNLDRARAWLDAGLDPNFEGDRIGTGLMIAAWEGNIPLMELFAARGADIDRRNRLGETALMHAAWKGHIEAVRWLLAHGARIKREPLQWTALHYAAFAGHTDIAELLLDRGADIDARTPNGSSALMLSVYEGREAAARRLLARGADVGVKNEYGEGALEWAMKYNQTEIARLVAATPQVFRAAATRPKTDWGPPQKSETLPKDLEDLLGKRKRLAERRMPLAKIDGDIAALRAKYARAAMKRSTPPARLEITASRTAPARQSARIVVDKNPPPVESLHAFDP